MSVATAWHFITHTHAHTRGAAARAVIGIGNDTGLDHRSPPRPEVIHKRHFFISVIGLDSKL